MTVPCYLDKPGCPPGSGFAYQKTRKTAFAWIPQRIKGNTMDAQFICVIPRVALTQPARLALYGHGLLGDPDEVMAGNIQSMTSEHDFVYCATREIGMADEDVPNAISILKDFSGFSTLADRLQQGLVNGLMLGRLMAHPQGLVTNAAFHNAAGAPVIDTSALYYDGNSQGGIFGGALTAIAPDFERSVLGVPGMNYSLLLPRSVDFDTYNAFWVPAYPNRLDRMLTLSVIQTLWDRGEADGYAQHMTGRPPANTPLHSVLLHVGLGDHQVAQISAENEARTIGAVGPPAGLRPRPQLRQDPALRHHARRRLHRGLGDRDLGQRPDPRRRHARHRRRAAREPPAASRQRSPRARPQHTGGASAEVRLPQDGRKAHGRVPGRPGLPHGLIKRPRSGRLHRGSWHASAARGAGAPASP